MDSCWIYLIKFIAFLILSGKLQVRRIGSLLVETPEGTKKDLPSVAYALAFLAGVIFLAAAYGMAISAWPGMKPVNGAYSYLGFAGTLLLFSVFAQLWVFWQNAAVTVKSCRPLLPPASGKCHSPFHDIGCQLPVDFSGTVLF